MVRKDRSIKGVKEMKYCFFYGHYTLSSDDYVRCGLFEKNVSREICEKCPFYIQHYKAVQIIKRYVFERETQGNHDEKGKKEM